MHLVPLSDFGVLKTYRLRDWCVCECTQIYKSMRSLILIEKVDPENEVLRLKTLKVKKLVWPWRLGIHSRNMTREDFCFYCFIFSFLSHRKHRTVKGGRGNTKEKFPCDAQLKILHLPVPSSEAIGNLIQFSQFLQWQRRTLLVSEEFVLTKELGIRQYELPT